MSFLYEITNNPRFWELDSVDIAPMKDRESEVLCRAVILAGTNYNASIFQLSTAKMDETIAALTARKTEIAGKGGARELAVAEGFIKEEAQ